MSTIWNRFATYPNKHKLITPSDTNSLPESCIIIANSDGDIAIEDEYGTNIVYAVTAGYVIPVIVKKVRATGTTVSSIIGVF